ncbi:hypothetical protein ABID94_003332 [Streptomyces sp. PvR018]
MIAQLVAADEDTVRDVLHRFNEIGLVFLAPRWAGGRPRLLSDDDEDFVVQTATTRPTKARPVLREIPPRSTSPHPPPDPVDQLASACRGPAQDRHRQQRLQHSPLLVRKIPSSHT